MATKPDGKVISATKGQVIEQWIFLVPNQSQVRFVNFLHTPGELCHTWSPITSCPGASSRDSSNLCPDLASYC